MPKNVAFSKILHNGNQPKSVINRRVNVARLDRVADAEQLKAHFHDGLLEVDLPKVPTSQATAVEVAIE